MSASSARCIADAEFPGTGSPRQKLGFAMKYAALALTDASWHPWEVRLEDTHLELMAKEDPDQATNDPDGREVIVGCGATLTYLKLALKHFGCLGRVALFPDLGLPRLVARVHCGFCGERSSQDRSLFEAMARGSSNVFSPGQTPFSEMMLTLLIQAAAGERGWLEFMQSEISRQRVMGITPARDSLWINFDHSSAQSINPAPTRHAFGGLPSLFAFGGRDIDSRNEPAELVSQSSFPSATLAIVKTKTDDKHGWLAAGLMMARIVLQAQALGLPWAFFNPVRRREARQALRVAVGHKGFAQAILCFGLLRAGKALLSPAPAAPSLAGPHAVSLNPS